MAKMVTSLFSLLVLVYGTGGCRPEAATGKQLNDTTFIDVYVALLEQTSHPDSVQTDTARFFDRSKIFSRFGTTEGAFREYVAAYSADPARWKVILDEVVKKLEGRMREAAQSSSR